MLQKSYQMKYFDKMKRLFAAIKHSFRKKVVLLREILRVRKKCLSQQPHIALLVRQE